MTTPAPWQSANHAGFIDEIRIALAMSGGIALTVYEAGVAHELWRAATALDSSGASVYRRALGEAKMRFIVDIITGASAGGINAIFLGSALSTNADFGALHDLWLEVADLARLEYRKNPESLLNNDAIRKAMATNLGVNMRQAPGRPTPDKEDLVVTVTRTNLGGRRRVLTDFLDHQAVVVTKEDPITFKAADFWRPERLDDLVNAAMATSAFPVVFPAVKMAETYYADGGLLDNQPVGHAIRAIRDKQAFYRTKRYVVFVEPNPDTSQEPAPHKPSATEVALQIPFLGVKGNIWNAILDMEDFNRRRAYYESVSAVMQESELQLLSARLAPPIVLAELRFDELFLAHDPMRYARWNAVADRAFGRDKVATVKWMVKVVEAAADMDFRLRWLRALIQAINLRLEPSDPLAEDGLGLIIAAEPGAESPKRILYRLLGELLDALYTRGKSERASPFNIGRRIDEWGKMLDKPDDQVTLTKDLTAFVDHVRDWTSAHAAAIARRIEDEVGRLAQTPGDFREICRYVCGVVEWSDVLEKTIPVGAALFNAFKQRDRLDYALSALTDLHYKLDIEFVRISPNDTTNLHLAGRMAPGPGESLAQAKLAGEVLGHMGGFLDERWRRNDYIWGRLDAAEIILILIAKSARDTNPAFSDMLRTYLPQVQQEILDDEYAKYQARGRQPSLPKPDVNQPKENQQWIGYGEETLASLPPEVIRNTTQYLVDTSLALAGGNPLVPTSLLDRASRALRALTLPLRVASWLMPSSRGAPGARISPAWPRLGVFALIVAAAYAVGRYPTLNLSDLAIKGMWIATAAFFVFLIGAVVGWREWWIVPAAAAIGLELGAATGLPWKDWVHAHVSALLGANLLLLAVLLVDVVLRVTGIGGRDRR